MENPLLTIRHSLLTSTFVVPDKIMHSYKHFYAYETGMNVPILKILAQTLKIVSSYNSQDFHI